jgi:hypothetical protein
MLDRNKLPLLLFARDGWLMNERAERLGYVRSANSSRPPLLPKAAGSRRYLAIAVSLGYEGDGTVLMDSFS